MNDMVMLVLFGIMLFLLVISFNDALYMRMQKVLHSNTEKRGWRRFEKMYWLWFALCLFAGVAVRVVQFGEFPLDLNQDGTMAGVEALSLLKSGKDHHGIAWPTYFKAWDRSQMSTLYSYILIPVIYLSDDLNLVILRLPMLVISILSLVIIWDLARRMLGRNYALLALLIVATNPWQIMQSRWALEANLFPHVFLIGVYLLYIGRNKRWMLYLSMVFFALTPYAYGVACFSTPVFLLIMASYYLYKKIIRPIDLVICVAVFLGISWPYFYTMVINAFGLEAAYIGPFTMPYFENSERANDLVFGREDVYRSMVDNLYGHFSTYLFNNDENGYNMMSWAGTMYTFMTPVYVYGCFRLWKERRRDERCTGGAVIGDGGMVILAWFCAALFGGIMVGGVVNRNNIVYYPLILLTAYGLYEMGKRMKVALVTAVLMVCVAFTGFCTTYFCDEEFRQKVEATHYKGAYAALKDTWDWDYDRYYVSGIFDVHLLFAHKIDYDILSEEKELLNSAGEPTGWYYSERYGAVNYDELDPMECAVYIVPQEEKHLFDEEDYIITDYSRYAAVYPRYWAE